MSALDFEQAQFALRCFNRWLGIREEFEVDAQQIEKLADGSYRKSGPHRFPAGSFTQLRADIDHSSLLMRLLSGKEPLPEPPPLRHAYPVYPGEPE